MHLLRACYLREKAGDDLANGTLDSSLGLGIGQNDSVSSEELDPGPGMIAHIISQGTVHIE
jgi:hypothetical protein